MFEIRSRDFNVLFSCLGLEEAKLKAYELSFYNSGKKYYITPEKSKSPLFIYVKKQGIVKVTKTRVSA